jgi:hypothetical protein
LKFDSVVFGQGWHPNHSLSQAWGIADISCKELVTQGEGHEKWLINLANHGETDDKKSLKVL